MWQFRLIINKYKSPRARGQAKALKRETKLTESLSHVPEVGGEREDGHHLAGDRHVEAETE